MLRQFHERHRAKSYTYDYCRGENR